MRGRPWILPPDALVIQSDDMTLVSMLPKDRGKITAIMMLAEP